MKKHLYLTIIIVALLSLAGWTGYARGQRTNSARQTWEYHVDVVPGTEVSHYGDNERVARDNAAADESLLNKRAAEGWELTAVGGVNYYFKRARQ
jgi:hypothetical protein